MVSDIEGGGGNRLKVFENKVLRRIFGPKKDEVTGDWRRLHTEELHDQYCLPNIIWVIKSTRVRWTEHVARMGRGEVCTGFWWVDLMEKYHLEDTSRDWIIILKFILKSGMVRHGLD